MTANIGLFMMLLLQQLGLFADVFENSGSSDGEVEGAEESSDPADAATYDAAEFVAELLGTDGAEGLDATGLEPNHAIFGEGGDDTIDATAGADYADGGAGDDMIEMYEGNDVALGGDGNDQIDGGIGHDTLFGGLGDDFITGNGGSDYIFGEDGADTLMGSGGADTIDGGDGNDEIHGNLPHLLESGADSSDSLIGGAGDDTIHIGVGDTAEGGIGADSFQIYGPSGTGLAEVSDFSLGEDVIVLNYDEVTDPISGDPVPPVVTVTANPAGTAAIVAINGIDVANVIGGQALTAADIALMPITV